MSLRIHRVQVWSGEIPDQPGAAAAMLEPLTRAGADLEFLMTRPHRHKPDVSVLFLAPVEGSAQTRPPLYIHTGDGSIHIEKI